MKNGNNAPTGFCAQDISPLGPEGQVILTAKLAAFRRSHEPANEAEHDLVEQMAAARTRQTLIERAQLSSGAADFDRLQRYLRDAERSFRRALADLLALRKSVNAEARARFRDEVLDAKLMAQAVESIEQTQHAAAGTGHSVFDYPDAEQKLEILIERLCSRLPRPHHMKHRTGPPSKPIGKAS